MKLIERSTRRPVTVFIFALAGVVFGWVSLQQLSTDLLPDITYPSLTVRTGYDGAAPIEVESLVSRPIENAVGVVNGVVRVTSSSRVDLSEVTLEFSWGTNMDLAGLDVRERLDVLNLPDDADAPLLIKYDPALDPIVRLGVSGSPDLGYLRRLAEEDVQRALERIEGVAGVVVSGGLEEEIQVELDERRMANLGLTTAQVLARIGQENVNVTGGRLLEGQSEFLVRTLNEIVQIEDLQEIVLSREDGAIVLLKDVARVFRGFKEREIVSRIDGEESVEVAIFKEGGTNTVTVSGAVTETLELLRQRLGKIDPNLKLTIVTDQARFIRQAVDEVLNTAMAGGALAILVLYLFLRSWKSTAIIGIAIPISVMATFFLMYVSDVSLNIMSLGGLTLGIGLLVDNAIVVLEAIDRRRADGMGEREAAVAGASEVGPAVVSSTITTVCVFFPIVFLEGVAGQLFSDQALTVTFSLVVSLLVALTVIPMLSSRTHGAEEPYGETGGGEAGERGIVSRSVYALALVLARALKLAFSVLATAVRWLIGIPAALFARLLAAVSVAYAAILARALAWRVLTILIAVTLLSGSLALFPRLGRELVPELIQGEFYADLELPPGTHLDVTDGVSARIEGAAEQLDGVRRVYAVVGTSNEQGGVSGELRENIGQVTVLLDEPISEAVEEQRMAALREVLDREERLGYRFGRPAYFSFRTPIEVEIRGFNLTILERLATELVGRMERIDGLTDVKSSTEGGNPELQIRFDRDRLASLDVSLADVADALRSKIQGAIATDVQRQDRTVDIRLRVEEQYRDSPQDLLELAVAQRGRTAIPLAAVATVERVEGPAEIRRSEGDRVATLTANLAGRDLASVNREIEQQLGEMVFPAGFDWQIGGQGQEMETSFDSLRLTILLAVFLVYLVMASQFESLIHPLVILFSIPFSLIGVLAALFVFDVTVSVVVVIGVILLTGIVVNNAILLIDSTNRLRSEGRSKVEALKRAASQRLRPILMTTATTVLGLTPMALGFGEGSELRAPMAITVIGGLLASTLLTLVVIPVVYSLVDRRA